MRVLDEAICTISENPTGMRSVAESQNERESEKRMRLVPNPAEESATQRPSPCTSRRVASVSAPASAPTPVAPIRRPSPFTPPWRIRSAKIGMRTA